MPRAFVSRHGQGVILDDVEALLDAIARKEDEGYKVCVVEGIDDLWTRAFQNRLGISGQFFQDYQKNPEADNPWEEIFHGVGWTSTRTDGLNFHIAGVLEYPGWVSKRNVTLGRGYHRRCWKAPDSYPISSNTVISCFLVEEHFYLFLVDAPMDIHSQCTRLSSDRSRTSLRLPLSKKRGGIMLPGVYRDPGPYEEPSVNVSEHRLFNSLVMFFGHSWHLRVLSVLLAQDARRGEEEEKWAYYFVYMLSVSLWHTNLEYLDRKIKDTSFNDIRRPSLDTNRLLHDCRQDLSVLQAGVQDTKDSLPSRVVERFNDAMNDKYFEDLINLLPLRALEYLDQDAEKLSRFLMDSFQLLLSSVSVQDAQTSLEQAVRGTLLTRLAFLYVPLSFVTGIFGMNITEINGGTPRWWALVISLVVVVACTAAFFWGLKMYAKFQNRWKSNADMV